MDSISKYNFKEAQLGPDFAKEKLTDFKKLIESGRSFVVISMPGVGVSYFLRYLATQTFARSAREARRAHFFHIDLYSLPSLTQHEFYKLLLTELGGKPSKKTDPELLTDSKEILANFSKDQAKIVLIFSRFDQLKKEFNNQFLSNIQSLTNVSPGKIVLIFTSVKPLNEIAPNALSGGNINFYSENLYFQPYSKDDLKALLAIESARQYPKPILDRLIDLSGGHNQLLHILLSSQKQQNLLLDQFVGLQMKGLLDYLDYTQRKTLQKITSKASHPERVKPFGPELRVEGRVEGSIDEYLLGVGLVRNKAKKNSQLSIVNYQFELFTPLLTEYIRLNLPVKLPVKESKLFKLLRKNMGSVVSKDEIFTEVWGENSEATDWALDALIYRLRKHPFIKSHGYIIESHKKVGYILIQT